MTRIKTRFRLVLPLVATVALASCGGGSVDNEQSLRIIQASPDAPLVNFLINGVRVRFNVNFKGGFGAVLGTPGRLDIAIEAILPGVDELIIDMPDTPLSAGQDYTFIVIGKDSDDSVEMLEFDSPIESVPEGNSRVQVAHAAPGVGAVDVYFTAPGDILSAATPIAQATYGNVPNARELVPVGTYVISVTPAGMPDTVLFDSSEITLRGGEDLLLVAVTNTATDADSAHISLVVNARGVTSEIPDKDLPTDLRVVHVSPDAPALDVVGDRLTDGAADVSFASELGYLANTGYVSAPPDSYTISGMTSVEPDTALFTFSGTLFAGQRSTMLAIGLLATINDLVLVDDIRSVYAEGKLRIVDAAPGSSAVDVYVQESGTDIASVNATLGNIGLGFASTHIGFEPGNYTVTFTVAGEKTVLAAAEVAATPGTVHTVILVDAVRVDESSDGRPPAVLLIDDLSS